MRLFPFLLLCAEPLLQAANPVTFTYSLQNETGSIAAVAADVAGNTYVALDVTSGDRQATPGAFQTQYAGGTCGTIVTGSLGTKVPVPCTAAFLVKLDPGGSVVWATYLGAANCDAYPTAIAADASGNVYMAGTTRSFDGTASSACPATSGSAFPTQSGDGFGFAAKLSADGSRLLYGTYLPGIGSVGSVAMALAGDGSLYLGGTVGHGDSIPASAGAYQTTSSAFTTGAALKLNPSGSALTYATYLGGSGSEDQTNLQGITADAAGNVYVTGNVIGLSSAQDFPVTPGVYQSAPAVDEGFVTKLNPAASALVYSTLLGGADSQVSAIRVDEEGRAYVLGSSPNLAATAGAFEPSNNPPPAWNPFTGMNQFLASLSADGSTLLYATYVSGAGALDVDSSGNAYVIGNAKSGFPVTPGAFRACFDEDPVAWRFSPQGALLGATYFGPQFTEAPSVLNNGTAGSSVAIAPNGMIIAASNGNLLDGVVGGFVSKFLVDDGQQGGACVSPIVQNTANYYNYGTAVAPGELVTLQGVGLGPQTGVTGSPGADGFLGTNLAGIQVLFDKFAAPLTYVQAGQINLQVPWETAGQSSTQVQVIAGGIMLPAFSLTVQTALPGLFYTNYPTNQILVANQDGSINSISNPAHAGDIIALFGTGAGPTNPPSVTGAYSPLNAGTTLALPVTVTIGGQNAAVIYAGAAPGLLSGYFQINVQVPPGVPAQTLSDLDLVIGPADMPVGQEVDQASIAVH